MRTLTPAQRRALRAKAHHLSACASIGQGGLTPAVLHEIDVSLRAHELVKIRVFAAERDVREAMLARICEALDAAPVQHLGKVLVVWRPAPEEAVAPPPARSRSAAKRQPQARRPRSPLPRTPSRPTPAAPPPPRGKGRRGAARHATPGGSRCRGIRRGGSGRPKEIDVHAEDDAKIILGEAQSAIGLGKEAAGRARRKASRSQAARRQGRHRQPRTVQVPRHRAPPPAGAPPAQVARNEPAIRRSGPRGSRTRALRPARRPPQCRPRSCR